MTDLEQWKRAALLKDRTRRVIRSRVRANEPIAEIAADYDVPEEFVTFLAQWELFAAQH